MPRGGQGIHAALLLYLVAERLACSEACTVCERLASCRMSTSRCALGACLSRFMASSCEMSAWVIVSIRASKYSIRVKSQYTSYCQATEERLLLGQLFRQLQPPLAAALWLCHLAPRRRLGRSRRRRHKHRSCRRSRYWSRRRCRRRRTASCAGCDDLAGCGASRLWLAAAATGEALPAGLAVRSVGGRAPRRRRGLGGRGGRGRRGGRGGRGGRRGGRGGRGPGRYPCGRLLLTGGCALRRAPRACLRARLKPQLL